MRILFRSFESFRVISEAPLAAKTEASSSKWNTREESHGSAGGGSLKLLSAASSAWTPHGQHAPPAQHGRPAPRMREWRHCQSFMRTKP